MEVIACIIIGYLIGAINPAYIIGRFKGMDIRENGSRNAGASNALIMFGKLLGVFCAVFDIAKPCIAIIVSKVLFEDFVYSYAITGVACILGHMYPIYMKFRGGKGLACLGGFILMFDVRVFVVMLLVEAVAAFLVDYICVVPISASIIFPVLYGIMSEDMVGVLIILIATACMLIKHVENIQRIKAGTEVHLSYLWKKDSELERINAGSSDDAKI